MIQKLKLVSHWLYSGLKTTCKLIQAENNLFCICYSFIKSFCKMQGLYMVSGVFDVPGGEEHLKILLVLDLLRQYQFYALQLVHSLLQ